MSLNTPMKIALAAVIIVFMAIGFYLLNYQSKLAENQLLVSNIKELNDQKDQIDSQLKQIDVLTLEQTKAKQDLEELVRKELPPVNLSEFVPFFLEQIEQLVADEKKATGDSSFALLSLTPGGAQDTTGPGAPGSKGPAPAPGAAKPPSAGSQVEALKNFSTSRVFQLSMKGKFATVIHFLRSLGSLKLKQLVTIQRIALAPTEGGGVGVSPVLSISLPLTAYLRQGGGQ